MKKIFLILFFTGCTFFDSSNEISIDKFQGLEETLDIVSWNIENFPKLDSTVDFLYPIIDSLNIDIIALQEISSTTAFNNLVSLLGNSWVGYRSENSGYGELAYLVNTSQVNLLNTPYKILTNDNYYFAYREPYVLEFSYNDVNYVLINIHYKCCDGSEDRRLQASFLLKEYIDTYLNGDNVIVAGDFNDNLIDDNNVFLPFFDDSLNYYFSDYNIAEGSSSYWSFPTYPSHIDHILISNELFQSVYNTQVLLIDQSYFNGFNDYNTFISDHRPIVIQLNINP